MSRGRTRRSRLFVEAIASLRADRGRSVLMLFGVATGTAMLAAVLVLGQGTRERVMGLVAKHGLDLVMVRAGGEVQVFAPRADRGLSVLFEGDARAIEAEVPGVRMVSTVQNQRGITVASQDRAVLTRAFGVEADWIEIRRWGMAEGEFLTGADLASLARVVMLGDRVARELFPEGGAVGQTVRVNGDPYLVKGVFIGMGASAAGDDWDDRIVVPFTTSSRRLFNRPSLEQIVLRVADASRVAGVAERIRLLLRERHRLGAGEADDFFVREPEDVSGAALGASATLERLGLATALVALLGGGLVILNLMLGAVTRRAPEIGMRRAAGARAEDIGRQFLLEALLLAGAGGVVGVVLGVALAGGLGALGVASARITWLPFAAAALACGALGVASGLAPARRAARLDPAAALRRAG
jgi:putative ABC transport system permease protein